MKERSRPMDQLALMLPPPDPVTVPSSVERPLVAALADLLIFVVSKDRVTEGGRDEREDP